VDLLTMEEVAELVHTSPSTVRYWRHTGYGPAGFRVGRRVLYERSDVEQWIRDLQETKARTRASTSR
jgi:excisionase family DNA binding protein